MVQVEVNNKYIDMNVKTAVKNVSEKTLRLLIG